MNQTMTNILRRNTNMCGIVGFITTETKVGEIDRARFLKQALIIDTLRGDDSTGVFGVGHEPFFDDGSAYYVKQVATGPEFVESKAYWEQMYDVSPYRCVVGHNRAATVGAVDVAGAHPFQVGHITLVHNGTLTNANVLPSPMNSLDGVTVDSHAIAHNLNIHSVEEVVENLYGAFALVWHDARDDSVNVVRNNKRPLHFSMGQSGKTLFFMSEGEMLHLLDKRIKLGLKEIYYPEEGQWLKWTGDSPLMAPEVKNMDLYEDKWPVHQSYYTSGRDSHNAHAYGYGTYDDDYDFGDTDRPKAQLPSERENYVFLGGRSQPVPMLLQEAMMQHDVVTEDRLRFTPQSRLPNPQDESRVTITGSLEGQKAVLYSLQGGTATVEKMSNDWTVRVVAVKVSAAGEPWFICRLVSTWTNPGVLTSTDGPLLVDKRGNVQMPNRVPGYNGEMVTHADFIAQVIEGCVMCHHYIGVRDAHDLVWVAEGAICPNCDDRQYVAPPSDPFEELSGHNSPAPESDSKLELTSDHSADGSTVH